MIKSLAIFSILALGLAAGPATAGEPIGSNWPEVARAHDPACDLSVTGDGQFYRIVASGLGANAPGRMILTNGDMKPLDWMIQAADDGRFARYYLPFRWHRRGGEVTVAVASARCSVSTRFAWTRAEVKLR